MKHKSLLFALCALSLAAVSCQKEASEPESPLYNKETNEVVTNFVLNISNVAGTKQSAGATQATSSNAFRGMDHATLFSYKLGANNSILAADASADKTYDLSELASAGTLGSADSRRVIEMSLPINTNTLLFYGKAVTGGEVYDGYSSYDCYGHLDEYSITQTVGSTVFQLGKRLTADKKTNFYVEEKLLAGILSLVMNTNLKGDNHVAIDKDDYPDGLTENPYKFDVAADEYPEINWLSYANVDGNSPVTTTVPLYPLEVKLANVYKQMTKINATGGELRSAAGETILLTVRDLWTIVNEVRCAIPLNKEEAVAKYFANKVHLRLKKYFNGNVDGEGSPVTNVTFQSLSGEDGIAAKFNSDVEKAARPFYGVAPYDANDWPTPAQLTALGSPVLAKFPLDYNLPLGATHINFDNEKKIFYYPLTFNTTGMGGAMEGGAYNAESYYYPAELMYFGNSPIRTSAKDHRPSEYPTGSAAWSTAANWSSDWNGAAVKASTRSVAMKYDINYGSALLESKVKYAVATLKDNNRAVQAYHEGVDLTDPALAAAFTEQDNEISVTETSFKLTGIVIGGVSQNVGWDYLPVKVGETPAYQYGFIYDRAIPAAAQSIPTAGTSSPNYTLVFDNFKAASESAGIYTADTQDKVYIALEFLNNCGQDFYGNYNIVPNGGHFYLIAELDPNATGVSDPTWPTNGYVLPPYKADGSSNQVKRVFMQDYKTSVTFSLGVNSLKHAYLTVPDLRSGSMTLGLSVDINWSTGLQFEDVVLGGE